jgi:hypothetical protein
VVLVAIQLLVPGLYLPPVLKMLKLSSNPPQTIISLPVQTAVCPARTEGALVIVVAVQVFAPGLYLPPVFRGKPLLPPQTIIWLPVHTAV